MKKCLIAGLLAMALLLSGCSQGAAPEETTAATEAPVSSQVTTTIRVGDVMPDFTVTTPDGERLTLSEVVKDKKLVVLNLWFASCSWCQKEFPVMELAYEKYQEDVEIIALNPVDTDTEVDEFILKNHLSFPMATCNKSLATALGVRGYPTSVFIDREGVICLIHAGAITDAQVFYDAFETFVSDDYQQRVYNSIAELVG